MDREEDCTVVQREEQPQQPDEDEDDEPLPFNSRRSATLDVETGVDSPLKPTLAYPYLTSQPYLNVQYEANVSSGDWDNMLTAKSSRLAPLSPASGFEARRNRVLRKMAPSLHNNPFDTMSSVRQFHPKFTESTDIESENSEWESESLDGFIVIESDSETELKPKSRKGKDGVQQHSLNDSSEIEQEAQNKKGNRSATHVSRSSDGGHQRWTLRKILSEIHDSDDLKLLYPQSLQHTAESRRYQSRTEADALALLTPATGKFSENHAELEIHDFSIYRTLEISKKGFSDQFSGQFEHLLTATRKRIKCLVDGVLQDRYQRCYVEGMHLATVVIGNLDDPTTVSTKDNIFLVTQHSGQKQMKYRLMSPSEGYKDYFTSFLWIADFTKHVFHYLAAESEAQNNVRLADFTLNFWRFINNYGWGNHQDELDDWHAMCGNITDFQKHIIRYGDFVRDQALIVKDSGTFEVLFAHEFWDEIGQSEKTMKKTAMKCGPTTVSEQIAATFLQSFPDWGKNKYDLLEVITPAPTVAKAHQNRCDRLRFPQKTAARLNRSFIEIAGKKYPHTAWALQRAAGALSRPMLSPSQVLGTAVIVRYQERYRFAYVKHVVNDSRIKVIWLLHAGQTICGTSDDGTYYPVGNELFFSDECSCLPIRCRDVLASYEVATFAEQAFEADGFFVSMMYRPEDQVFCTVNPDQISGCLSCKADTGSRDLNTCSTAASLEILSLFSGCGLLDHGLASAGNFKTTLAIEIDSTALLSHKANTPNDCDHVCVSTNDYLAAVATGRRSYGMHNLLVAGCPCQGFSRRNAHRNTAEAQRNCSMLANTLSYVDLFRPEYVLIENVEDMDRGNAAAGEANACAQAICCLVAMGYQVRKMVLDGANYDAATNRARLFLVAAAPGLKLPEVPTVVQVQDPKSAYTALEGLDAVHNDTTVNIKVPDHIPFKRLQNNFSAGVSLLDIVKRVPVIKSGSRTRDDRSLYGAWSGGHLTHQQEQWFASLTDEKQSKGSGALRRVNPEDRFPTITRSYVPLDSRAGAFIHPHQHRVVTCEELRRAQGVPDEFILIGTTADAISQVGNGVVWEVAQALGRSIQEAWSASQPLITRNDGDRDDDDDADGKPAAIEAPLAIPEKDVYNGAKQDVMSTPVKGTGQTPKRLFKSYPSLPMMPRTPDRTPKRPFKSYEPSSTPRQRVCVEIPKRSYQSDRKLSTQLTSTEPSDGKKDGDGDVDVVFLWESPTAVRLNQQPNETEHSAKKPKPSDKKNADEWYF